MTTLNAKLTITVVTTIGTKTDHVYDIPSDDEERDALFEDIENRVVYAFDPTKNVAAAFHNPLTFYKPAQLISIALDYVVYPSDEPFDARVERRLGFAQHARGSSEP